jgi:tRNA acetyltransferase TAN1
MLRVTPVLGTCRADSEKISALSKEILPKYLDSDFAGTFSIIYKARNNNNISRRTIFDAVGSVMKDIAPKIKVDYDAPDLVITVDVIKSVCCLGIVHDFFKFRKYNIQEVAKIQAKPEKLPDKPSEAKEGSQISPADTSEKEEGTHSNNGATEKSETGNTVRESQVEEVKKDTPTVNPNEEPSAGIVISSEVYAPTGNAQSDECVLKSALPDL